MDDEYKAAKEAFVSGLQGGSIWEINSVTAIALTSYVLWSGIQVKYHSFDKPSPGVFGLEFAISILPIILTFSVLSQYSLLINLLFITIAIALQYTADDPSRIDRAAAKARKKRWVKDSDDEAELTGVVTEGEEKRVIKEKPKVQSADRKPFLSAYRATMMTLTCFAILAVDFPAFPRRFAKVETWGTSVMDMGVGSFVFSSGIVSARPFLRDQGNKSSGNLAKQFQASLRQSLPLLALGGIRLIMTKGVDYPEHVTEYGVHWNFFFTLGFLPPFVTLCRAAQGYMRFATIGLLVSAAYQLALSYGGLQDYILHAPRTDLISANKEGIASFAGYLSIFVIGLDTGFYVLPADPYYAMRQKAKARTKPQRDKLALVLASYSILWCTLFAVTTMAMKIQVSRQMANLSYVIWVAAYNTTFLLLFLCVEVYFFPSAGIDGKRAIPEISNAMNQNGLVVFLIANLLTGAVNISIRTIQTRDGIAVIILTSYMAIVCSVAWLLRGSRLRL